MEFKKLGPRHGPRHDFAKSNSFIQLRRLRNVATFLSRIMTERNIFLL